MGETYRHGDVGVLQRGADKVAPGARDVRVLCGLIPVTVARRLRFNGAHLLAEDHLFASASERVRRGKSEGDVPLARCR